MDDARWFEKLLSDIAEEIWRTEQISRELQEYRKNIQYQWDDEAARELNGRYLNPHEDDGEKMLSMLKEQKESLNQINICLQSIYQHGIQVNLLSSEIEDTLQTVQQEIHRAYANHAIYRDNYLVSIELVPTIYKLIDQANSMQN